MSKNSPLFLYQPIRPSGLQVHLFQIPYKQVTNDCAKKKMKMKNDQEHPVLALRTFFPSSMPDSLGCPGSSILPMRLLYVLLDFAMPLFVATACSGFEALDLTFCAERLH